MASLVTTTRFLFLFPSSRTSLLLPRLLTRPPLRCFAAAAAASPFSLRRSRLKAEGGVAKVAAAKPLTLNGNRWTRGAATAGGSGVAETASATAASATKENSDNNNENLSLKATISSPSLSASTTTTTTTTIKENILTIPNVLTGARMALSPLIGYLVLIHSYGPAMVIFVFAGLTDMLDGYIARNFKNQSSTLGMAIDPLADKLLMTVMAVSLSMVNLLPPTLTLLIVTRDVLLIASGFALRWFSLPPPMTIKRYFDISLPSAEVYPTFTSKLNTVVQISTIAASLAAPLFGFIDATWLRALWVLTGVTTVVSGASYAYNGANCFKILSEKENVIRHGSGASMKAVRVAGGVGFALGLMFVMWKVTS